MKIGAQLQENGEQFWWQQQNRVLTTFASLAPWRGAKPIQKAMWISW